MFKIINFSLGAIKAGLQQNIYFPYENIQEIVKIHAPCDCSKPFNESNNNRLLVRYVPKAVPIHLKQEGKHEYTTKKIITVEYKTKDNPTVKQTILLSFTAVVKD